MAELNVNGKPARTNAEGDTPLLWVLRESLGLTGTKYGCGIGQCGACTVHFDNSAVRACTVPLSAVRPGVKIVTIEGLRQSRWRLVQEAWAELDVPQCGYCQAGMIMAAAAPLMRNPKPTEEDIHAGIGNICRCGTYTRVLAAVQLASKRLA